MSRSFQKAQFISEANLESVHNLNGNHGANLWYKFIRRPWTRSSNGFVVNTFLIIYLSPTYFIFLMPVFILWRHYILCDIIPSCFNVPSTGMPVRRKHYDQNLKMLSKNYDAFFFRPKRLEPALMYKWRLFVRGWNDKKSENV